MPPEEIANIWDDEFRNFLREGAKNNATFALHVNMMDQLDGVLAISLAERLGGPDGYNLLLAAVKMSLPYSFVNGAASYGPYVNHFVDDICVEPLYGLTYLGVKNGW